MDIYLNKEKLSFVKNVLSTCLAQEETMEMIVPDAMPDILRIVDTDAAVFLRSKSSDNGRATITGNVDATVLYCPEGEKGLRKLALDIPFSMSVTDSDINPSTRVTAVVNAASADASMINPRKIIVRVDLIADVACYNDAEMVVSENIEDDADAGIEIMTNTSDMVTTTAVKEKTFVVADEINVPHPNPPVGTILKYKVDLSPQETKAVGSKLILRGTADVALIYLPPEGEDLCRLDHTTEFSQIIELDSPESEGFYDIDLMLTNAYFDADNTPSNPDGRKVVMELSAVAQCVASEKKTVTYIADMYSTRYPLFPEVEQYAFDTRSHSKASAVYHNILKTPKPAAKVLALNVRTGAVEKKLDNALKCPLYINAVYETEDGEIFSVSQKAEVEANADVSENAKLSANAKCGKEVFSAAVSEGIDLRIPVEINITEMLENKVNMLSGLSYDESNPIDNSKYPSLVVARPSDQDSLWNLAKKYRSTPNLILAANELAGEEEIAPGKLLIIPKK